MTLTKKAEATREHILDTGRALVLRKGFSGLGLQEILTTCGVPKGSFYHYFPSKEAYGCALLQHYVDDYARRLEALLAPAPHDGRTLLMRYWSAWLGDAERAAWVDGCLVVKLAAEVSDLSEDMRQVLDAGVQRLLARLARLIDAGRADGSIPPGAPALAVARLLYQMWLGAALLAKLGRDPAPLRQALSATEHLLACGTDAAVPASLQ
ncbi:TetR/AcrR family transcriptional regulator [Achromobacter sp. GG226]|uniref:TetR/AcrR family transcriptional regulator n=1 Tax=Verticiella alkaliphila TaxID=2779529 RepID=UPI001C0E0840|nr:TetR/AcrR family transcriptional regulator [Verticiella sp. GG226]MBU4610853.1 TetR/AcrR family transcriptional regulator [Verticiella sp. GG226]